MFTVNPLVIYTSRSSLFKLMSELLIKFFSEKNVLEINKEFIHTYQNFILENLLLNWLD